MNAVNILKLKIITGNQLKKKNKNLNVSNKVIYLDIIYNKITANIFSIYIKINCKLITGKRV